MKQKKQNQWQNNQDKAIEMTEKFIAVIKKLDCYDTWQSIMMSAIVGELITDSKRSGEADFDSIADELECNFGFTILKANSLAEQMKIEDFVSDLKKNPYQLALIA